MNNYPNVDWIDAASKAARDRLGTRLTNELWWQKWVREAWDAVGTWPDLQTYSYSLSCPTSMRQPSCEGGFVGHPSGVLTFKAMALVGPNARGPDFILMDSSGRKRMIVEAKINNTPTATQVIQYERSHDLPMVLLLSSGNANEGDLIALNADQLRRIILWEQILRHVDTSQDERYGPLKLRLTSVLTALRPELERLATRRNAGIPPSVRTFDMTRPDSYYGWCSLWASTIGQ